MPKKEMPKVAHIDIGVGYVNIHENYLIMEINPDITLTVKDNEILLNLVETFYKDKNFVYISNRENSYAIDPIVYFEVQKIKNLIGLAIVSKKEITKFNASVEKHFFSKPFEIFNNLDEATSWANNLYAEHS
ncbi:hypothetical protein KO494_11390 [Lacinutrix sp. C3R15]|uniref:hypothetical protein n=1 Tax=Flavobacteriaceae TaxID=49546 RepID=UPI001C07FB78|nr:MULTISPECIES: hypothetical protein [Flavobacteriaceae]MBU2940142.1 hypothetical protein [Lacinutrix sp. C3R15]MDO6623459.1 hypothetical protein [Oceanihabitans sp. 1_MG-2023]